jgi:hypothetical protein
MGGDNSTVLLYNKRESNRIPDWGVWFIYLGVRDDRVDGIRK